MVDYALVILATIITLLISVSVYPVVWFKMANKLNIITYIKFIFYE